MKTRRGRLAADANMEYDRKMRDVRQLLREMDKQLLKHEARQGGPANRLDWGFVGDLEHVEGELTDILRFLGSGGR